MMRLSNCQMSKKEKREPRGLVLAKRLIQQCDIADKHGVTDFLGYDTEVAQAQVIAIVKDGALIESAGKGDRVQLIFNQTHFMEKAAVKLNVEILDLKMVKQILLTLSVPMVFSFIWQKLTQEYYL